RSTFRSSKPTETSVRTVESSLDRSQELTPTSLPPDLLPTTEELAVLSPFERFAYRLTRRMNHGAWKRFWTWCQSTMGAGWIHLSTYNIMNVYGLENVE